MGILHFLCFYCGIEMLLHTLLQKGFIQESQKLDTLINDLEFEDALEILKKVY